MIGGAYAEEQDEPLRRAFCLLLRPLSRRGSVDREHPEHRDAEQWNPVNFERWYRDLRRAIVALATTGDPTTIRPESACVQLKAYVPAKCGWQPMCAFHEFMLRRLGDGKGGRAGSSFDLRAPVGLGRF